MKSIKQNKKHYLFPCSLIGILVLPALNVFFSIYALQFAFVYMQMTAFIIILVLYSYLYYKIEAKITYLYFDIFKWKKVIFYAAYYVILDVIYRIAYSFFMLYVAKHGKFLFTDFGAFLSYSFKIFEVIILYQIALKIIRGIYRKLYVRISMVKRLKYSK